MIHDLKTDAILFCCDLRYVKDQTCVRPSPSCGRSCNAWLIGFFLCTSFFGSLGMACCLRLSSSKIGTNSQMKAEPHDLNAMALPPDSRDHSKRSNSDSRSTEEEPSKVEDVKPHFPTAALQHSDAKADEVMRPSAFRPPDVEVRPSLTRNDAALVMTLPPPDEAGDQSLTQRDMALAMAKIKELELLSRIRSLEHELRVVEMSGASNSASHC